MSPIIAEILEGGQIVASLDNNAPAAITLINGAPRGSGVGGVSNIYAQDTEPTPPLGSGEFVWLKLDGSGNLLDILSGTA